MLRLILTGPGIRKDRYEWLLPADAALWETVSEYWVDPSAVDQGVAPASNGC